MHADVLNAQHLGRRLASHEMVSVEQLATIRTVLWKVSISDSVNMTPNQLRVNLRLASLVPAMIQSVEG